MVKEAVDRRGNSYTLEAAVYDFFQDCAQSIMAYEKAIFEIVYTSREGDRNPVGFELVSTPPGSVFCRLGKWKQSIPADYAKGKALPRTIALPAENIIVFEQPVYVRKKIGGIMESLAFLSGDLFPSFTLEATDEESNRVPYNPMELIRSRRLAMADAGKLIGWNARGTFNDQTLEYYQLHRFLLLKKFQIELRNSIHSTLNEVIDRAGAKLGFSGHLEIEGLSTLVEVETAQKHLALGDCPFKDIIAPFLTL